MKKQIACLLSIASAAIAPVLGQDWKEHTISPVTNPLFFEDPLIHSEVRPIFMHHEIPSSFVTQGGDVRVYAIELRYAVTERFAIIATKDGYIEFNPKAVLKHEDGWADIAAGVKYALIDDAAHNFVLTPGVKFEVPTGNKRVFQGNGSGEANIFVSAVKGWEDFHATASVGARIPVDFDDETASTHYSLQLDYYVCQYFIPFVAVNGFTVISEGKGLALGTEGFDLINFGTSNASGVTQAAFGTGFRSRLLPKLDVGFAFETAITTPKGLYDKRFTVDLIYRF